MCTAAAGIQVPRHCWAESLRFSVAIGGQHHSVPCSMSLSSMAACLTKVGKLRKQQKGKASKVDVKVLYNLITEATAHLLPYSIH